MQGALGTYFQGEKNAGIVIAAFMAVAQKSRPGVMGIALGLLCNAALLLSFDLVAERRGATYKSAIEENAAISAKSRAR